MHLLLPILFETVLLKAVPGLENYFIIPFLTLHSKCIIMCNSDENRNKDVDEKYVFHT